MKKTFLILFLLSVFCMNAQHSEANKHSEKGVSQLPTPNSSVGTSNNKLSTKIYAVIVGISDYQDPGIPDLQYADKDAEAFANYLRSQSGGALDKDHLKVLINQQATMAQFANTLDWLIENVKENDQVIIYFSGHGDVERKTISQPGYLLCWDAPARVYLAGGALALPMFQDIVTTLSAQNKAKVIVITDACHSGKLAGSSVGGSQITGANLAKQYSNEIKILSCQPNEHSIEGEQWGGGRGAFSYHLIDALYGLADANNDKFVTLQEIGRYLEDHVTAEVAPVSQVPMVLGNRAERLASVDEKLLASIRSGKSNQMAMLSAVESRGIEDDVLSKVDSSVRKLYQLFKNALKDQLFLIPLNACADTYYEKLIKEPKLERLHSTMRRNYAAALQDDAQQVMNKWLKTDLSEIVLSKQTRTKKYQHFPRYLERAAQLLGTKHYMYPILQARKHLFDGYLISFSNFNPNKEVGEKALAQYREALKWQADLPHAYWLMSFVYGYNIPQVDSAEYYTLKASALAPSWELPYTDMAYLFSTKWKQFDRAKFYLNQADLIDSNTVNVLNAWAIYYNNQKQFEKAEQLFKKIIQLDSNFVWGYNNLGGHYIATGRYAEAETVLKKAIQLDSTNFNSISNLGFVYIQTSHYAEAEQQFKKAIQLDSINVAAYDNLGYVYFQTDRYAEAEQQFKKVIQLDSTIKKAYYNLACLQSLQNHLDKAYEYLEHAIKIGLNEYEAFQQDSDLAALREQKEQWNALMKKYFPEKGKN